MMARMFCESDQGESGSSEGCSDAGLDLPPEVQWSEGSPGPELILPPEVRRAERTAQEVPEMPPLEPG